LVRDILLKVNNSARALRQLQATEETARKGRVMAKSTASDPIHPGRELLGIHALQAFTNGLGIAIEDGAHKGERHGRANVGIDPGPSILDFRWVSGWWLWLHHENHTRLA
jgi:hypothetical protein